MEQTEREGPKVGLSAGLGATQIEIADTVHHGPTGEDLVKVTVEQQEDMK